MKKAVQADNLIHKYKDLEIINNLSFFVRAGEFFIITGPNGSGKTTIVKILAGIEKRDSGNLRIMDHFIESYSKKEFARIIAFVPQNIIVDFPFTVSEIVLMGRAPHTGILGIENQSDMEIATQAMKFTGVHNLWNRKLNELSGGEQQRVFIARAICQKPKIILLDEPTAALDLAHQIHIMDLLEQLKQKQNMTVIMVSHDLNLAGMYAERLLLLKQGKIVKLGTPYQVLTQNTLESVYGCRLVTDKSRLGDFPLITPIPERFFSR